MNNKSISGDDINRDFVVMTPYTPIQAIRDQLYEREWDYVIEPLADGRFRVYQLTHLVVACKEKFGVSPDYSEMEQTPVGEVRELDRLTTIAVEQHGEMDTIDAKRKALTQPLELLVVLDKGEIVGVLVAALRDIEEEPLDYDYLPPSFESVEPEELMIDEGDVEVAFDTEDDESEAATLSVDDDDSPLSVTQPDTSNLPLDDRIINVELRDDLFDPVDARTQALETGREYRLDFFVDKKSSKNTIVSGETIEDRFFEGEIEGIDLTIRLESEDFEIDEKEQAWFVPRTGKSGKARFSIKPIQDGPATISAIVLKGEQFVQAITLKFFVGELFSIERAGHSLTSSMLPKSRDLNITILDQGNGYQVIMSGAVGAVAKLPLTRAYLHDMVKVFRKTLQKEIVYFKDPSRNRLTFQKQLDIPKGVRDRSLVILANAGWDLFDKLFYGSAHDLQARNMGDKLKEMAKRNELNIQIFAQNFPLPWGFLYIGENPDNPEPSHFLGLSHVIESIPLQPSMSVTDNVINTSKGLNIGLNVNLDIDRDMRSPIIANQLNYWKSLSINNSNIRPDVRDSMMDVMEGLKGEESEDQILYFYCHAISYHLEDEDRGGPDRTRMIFTGHKEFTLRDARRDKTELKGKPLVFINACETAKLSPEFYDGFVPYFMSKGARGVIGTECEVPALFAEAYAETFFNEFLKGKRTLGRIFLDMRQTFFKEHNNILGLMYALYIDGDTYISDPLLD